MLVRALPVLNATPCRRSPSHFQLIPKLKCAKIGREAKCLFSFLFRPSWKRMLGHLRNAGSTTTVAETSSSCETETLVDDGSESSSDLGRRKTVRFDDEPAIFFRKSRIKTPKRSSLKLPERPCLVRRYSELSTPTSEDGADSDAESIYEDCIGGSMCPKSNVAELGDSRLLHWFRPDGSPTSFVYETESSTVELDSQEYGLYCLAKYLDKQREEMAGPPKLVFEHPALLPWPSRIPSETIRIVAPSPPSPSETILSPSHSRLRHLRQCIVDELQNAVVVLCIGLAIHMCIFLFFLYNVFTRGLLRSQ